MITYINKRNGVGMRLEELCQLRGVSGDEKEVHDFLYDEYKKRNKTYEKYIYSFTKISLI